jgi:hypothetical protein
MATIFCKPPGVKCSLANTSLNASLQSSKSPRFWVNKGYFEKCDAMFFNSRVDEITSRTMSEPCLCIPPSREK